MSEIEVIYFLSCLLAHLLTHLLTYLLIYLLNILQQYEAPQFAGDLRTYLVGKYIQ